MQLHQGLAIETLSLLNLAKLVVVFSFFLVQILLQSLVALSRALLPYFLVARPFQHDEFFCVLDLLANFCELQGAGGARRVHFCFQLAQLMAFCVGRTHLLTHTLCFAPTVLEARAARVCMSLLQLGESFLALLLLVIFYSRCELSSLQPPLLCSLVYLRLPLLLFLSNSFQFNSSHAVRLLSLLNSMEQLPLEHSLFLSVLREYACRFNAFIPTLLGS